MLQPKCRQPYVHGGGDDAAPNANGDGTPRLPPRPPLPKQPPVVVLPPPPPPPAASTLDRDLIKQQQLSDWYYIKTGPKSPLPPRAADKRNAIYSRVADINGSPKVAVHEKAAAAKGIVARETAKNNMKIYSECVQRRAQSGDRQSSVTCDVRIVEDTVARQRVHGDEIVSDDSHYQEIGIPSVYGSIGAAKRPPPNEHQYASNEAVFKLKSTNNNNNNNVRDKVNGFTMWQQQHQKPQEQQYSEKQRLLLLSPPSPSLSAQKHHRTTIANPNPVATHPYYYVEPAQKPIERHLSSPRQQRQIKLCEQQADECQHSASDPNRPHCPPIGHTSDRFGTIDSATTGSDGHSLQSSSTAERPAIGGGAVSTSQLIVNEQQQQQPPTIGNKQHAIRVGAAANGCLSGSQQCLQQQTIAATISSSPSMPLANQQSKVRKAHEYTHSLHAKCAMGETRKTRLIGFLRARAVVASLFSGDFEDGRMFCFAFFGRICK